MIDDLTSDLDRAAARLDVPAGDLGAVVARGRRRSQRRRRALAGVTALAIVGATATGIGLAGRGGGDDATDFATTSLHEGDVGVSWRAVPASSALGYVDGVAGTGPLYALSTAAGQRNVTRGKDVVWRSADGVDWTSVTTLSDDLYLSDLTSGDSRLYAVGTGPATAAVGGRTASPLLVGWSDDGGKTWQKSNLPIDFASMAGKASHTGVYFTKIAAGPRGVVAVAVPDAELDVARLVPAGVSLTHGWALADDGIDVLGAGNGTRCPDGLSPVPPDAPAAAREKLPLATAEKPAARRFTDSCFAADGTERQVEPQEAQGVAAHLTWDQLRVDGDLLRAVRHEPVAFVAAPGSTSFERVGDLDLGPDTAPMLVSADGDGFELVTSTDRKGRNAEVVVHRSADGRTWTRAGQPTSGFSYAMAGGRLAGRSALLGGGTDGDALLLTGDGAGGWVRTNLAGALGSLPPKAQVSMAGGAVGPLGAVAVVAVTDADQLKAERIGRDGSGFTPPTYHLLTTRDGTTWSNRLLDEVAGAKVGVVQRVTIAGDRAVVMVTPLGSKQQVALVGTPD